MVEIGSFGIFGPGKWEEREYYFLGGYDISSGNCHTAKRKRNTVFPPTGNLTGKLARNNAPGEEEPQGAVPEGVHHHSEERSHR